MVSREHYYHSIQRQSRYNDHVDNVLYIVNADGIDETYGTYVDDDTGHDTDHDMTF